MESVREHVVSYDLPVAHERETWVRRALRFVRACVVGSGATLVDFSILTTCIRVLDLAPSFARIPALLAGASVQFFGNRSYTFRATRGSLTRQARLFVFVELVTLALNYAVFRQLVPRVHAVPPEIVSFLGTFIVFIGFAYPMRKLVVFRLPEA
jgi:putative flippase GtrA